MVTSDSAGALLGHILYNILYALIPLSADGFVSRKPGSLGRINHSQGSQMICKTLWTAQQGRSLHLCIAAVGTSEHGGSVVAPVGAVQPMQVPRQAHHECQLDLLLEEPAPCRSSGRPARHQEHPHWGCRRRELLGSGTPWACKHIRRLVRTSARSSQWLLGQTDPRKPLSL